MRAEQATEATAATEATEIPLMPYLTGRNIRSDLRATAAMAVTAEVRVSTVRAMCRANPLAAERAATAEGAATAAALLIFQTLSILCMCMVTPRTAAGEVTAVTDIPAATVVTEVPEAKERKAETDLFSTRSKTAEKAATAVTAV